MGEHDATRDEHPVRLPLSAAPGGPGASTTITPAVIRAVIEDFYAACRGHPVLGPVFAAHVTDWPAHLDRIQAFWEAAILRRPGYAGRPLEAHLAIDALDRRHFSTWLRLFRDAAGRHCTPADVEVFMTMAGRMANRMMAATGITARPE
jgi:hemoglobin